MAGGGEGSLGDTEGFSQWWPAVASGLAAAGLRPGDLALHLSRHLSLRDAVKWCRRMEGV